MKNRMLRLPKIACAAGIVLLMAGEAQAEIINFTSMDFRDSTVNVGTVTPFSEPADGTAVSSLSYTVTGLTIDSDGSGNDEITVTLGISALGTGTPTINWDHSTATVREWDHNNGTFNVAGEGIAFGTIGVTGILSSGDALVVNSAKYTEWTFRRWHNDEVVSIDGDGAAFNYSSASGAVALDDTAFSVTHVSGGSWNGNHLDFSVDVSSSAAAVPEPSSFALIGGAFACFAMRRRRRRSKTAA